MQRPELHIESVPWDFQADDARAGLIPQQPAPMPGPPMLGLGGDPAAASAPAPGGPADGPPVRRKKKKRRHRVARETALPEAFSSLTSFRGGTRLNMFEPQDPAVAPELRKMRSMREMGLEELMARAGMAPPGAETDSPGREPEMEQIRLGRTTPVPLFPLSALEMGAETAKKKKKKKKRHHHHHRKRDGEVDLGEIDLGTYSHPVIDIEGEIAGPLEPPSPRQDEKPEMFLPIPPPPPAPTMPGWLSPLFPFVGTLAPFLASRHPNLATNILSRAWILLLLAVWIVVSYVPFLPPSGTSKFATDAMNYTTALHNAGNAIYSVSTRAGYEQFRHVASLNVNSGAPGAILPPWPEFAKQKSVNGSKILTPKQACINFLEQRDWTLPGYSITGIPDATVSNDTSLVDIKWLGSQVPGWGVSRYNGGPGLRSAVEYLTDTLDRLTGMSFQNARVADIQKVIDGIYTRDSDPQIDWSSQSTEFPDVIDGETGDYVVPKIGLRTVVTSGINWISVHVPSNVAGSNKEAIILVAGIDTPAPEPPLPTAAAAAALLLALVPMIQTPLSIPALPYDVILLFISGTAAPTQETTLSAPSSAWYSNAGATGLLMQPAFRHFLSNTTYADDLEIRTVLWLGPIGAGPIELEYGSELATSISVFDGITVEKVTRMQGLPQSGVGSSLGRWIRSQSNATWTTPFLGPLWDQREAKLQASMGGLGTGTERIRFIHAYTKGAADRTNWDDAPTLGSLDAFGTFLVSAVSDPAKFEAQADHATDYKDYSYYPFAGSIVSWSPVGSYIFAVVDFLLATGSMVWAGHRRYATAEGSPWTIEARAWLWTFLLWIAGLCVVGVLLPTGIWWAVTSSGASLKLYLSLGLPSMIPSPSLPLLSASVMLAWSAVSTGESTVPALHVAGIWLMALINLVLTAVMPSANWVLSWTVFFGLFFGVLEFWCEEYGRWLIKVEDLEHYDEMLEEFTLWEDEQEFAEKLNGEMVEDWYAVMDDGIGGPPDGHSASFGRSQSPGGRHRSGVMFDASANRGRSGFVNATGTRARSTFIDATAADHLSELLDATAARAQSNYLEVTTARARMLESILHPEAPLWDSAVASAPSDALGTPGRDDTRPRSRTEAMDSSRGRTRSLSRRRSANFGAHAHASPSFASAERHLSQRNQTHLGVPHARRAAAETWNTPMYADIDTLGGAMALSDIVDDMMQNGGSFDAEEIEDEGPSILERSNAEVYRLFYTPHLYHHPTTFFLVLRAVFLPFMAFAPIWAAVTATETSTAQMSSWANDVTGVPWVAVIPSVVTALAVTSVTPLWAMWSENRVTSRGVEKDWWWVRWLVPVALFVAFLGTFIAGYTRAAQFQNGGSFPVPTTIGYFLDTSLPFGSSGSALFYTVDETAYTPFSLQFLGYALAADEYHWIPMPIYLDYGRSPTGIRQKGRQSIQSNAALWSLVPPEAAVLSDLYTNGTNQRDIVLQITSPRGAVNFAVQVVAPANVLSLRVWGANVDLSKPPAPYVNSSSTGAFNRFHVECVPCPPDGVRIGMTLVASDSNLTITVKTSETSWGLPYKDSSTAFPPFQWDDRPLGKEIMGSWWGMADPTVVYAQNLLFSKFNTSGLENGTLTTVSASTTLASTGTVSSVKTTVASTKSTVKSSSSTRRTTKKVNKRHYQ